MQKLIRNDAIAAVCLVLVVLGLSGGQVSGKSVLDELKGASNSLTDALSNVCLTNDGCNKDFFTLRNYCCGAQCCNYVQFVFQSNE